MRKTASNVRQGDVVVIKTAKSQTFQTAPRWRVLNTDVIEFGEHVASVYWKLAPVGVHSYTGARSGQHEYGPHPFGQYEVVESLS